MEAPWVPTLIKPLSLLRILKSSQQHVKGKTFFFNSYLSIFANVNVRLSKMRKVTKHFPSMSVNMLFTSLAGFNFCFLCLDTVLFREAVS
jgi:hypothetical protein